MNRWLAVVLSAAVALPLPGEPAVTKETRRAAHVLNRLAFGARPGDIDRLTSIGVDRWIAQQLQPERIPDMVLEQRLDGYETLSWSTAEVMRRAGRSVSMEERRQEGRRLMAELTSQRILRAAESERQLHEVMVDFWMNHFNVFAGKGIDRFLLTSFERDAIRPNIWGRFEDLLLSTAKSPAMLFYLDNARSVASPENRRGMARMVSRGGLNENYARELMELHTLGVDGGYTQRDVTELARVLTGWSIDRESGAFVFRRPLHDQAAKEVLGVKLAPGGGIEEGERMIRFLAAHPSTARHIALKLSQRLVADDPPPALVERVAKRFRETRGDLRETVKAVITSPEFNDPKYFGAKIKSPFEYTISAVRALGGTIINPLPLGRELQKMGQPLYMAQPPTGYADDAAAWVNSGALVARINFALALTGNTIPGIRVDSDTDPLAAAGIDLTPETRRTLAGKNDAEPSVIAGLVIGSPEFQRQ